ncbi:reverse transcriptase-like protein [Aerococcus agrisoli]|uniref:Reverse transcriptase-like protein n=1 Tax=Aerococcus agrisoli TaxID=2487350 RepID=A0A3N4H2C2_9LACT|nr:ribonuclease HI family protein [Aerococcus agrisoli]RPA64960.1 reverse transcriptase-like protein [Aerococcus agrisoli]
MLRIAIDGSVDGQFGAAGVGIVLVKNGQQTQLRQPLVGQMDNHEAEFRALLHLLTVLEDDDLQNEMIICQTDSKIVYDAVHKRHHKREPYQSLLKEILKHLDHFSLFTLNWVPDRENKGADNLARQAMHEAKAKM